MKVENVRVEAIRPNPDNPRKITRKELEKLKNSIQEFGLVDPIIVNRHDTRNGIIIGGHQRLEAAKSLGYTEVPVTYVDLTQEREEQLNIALNRISGEWDEDKLQNLLKRMYDDGIPITHTGHQRERLEQD